MKKLLALVVALVLVMSLATVASAADYPTKGISVICPWGAGGGTDACLRAFCLALEKQLGVSLTVDNLTGASGVIGHEAIADADADGYTMGMITFELSAYNAQVYPIILVVSLLGAFSINKNVFDVGVCVVFGVIGWLMNKYEFPLSPILLALILGPMCEQNFVRFMDLNGGNFMAITGRPIAVGFFIVAVVLFSIYNQQKINKREAAAKAAEKAAK